GAEQIVRKLRDAEALLNSGKTIGEACQSLEVSEQTFHRWRKKYGGMKAEEAKRLDDLDQENGRLKKLVAGLSCRFRCRRSSRGETLRMLELVRKHPQYGYRRIEV